MPRILSLCDREKEERFFLGQRGKNLVLARTSEEGNTDIYQIGRDALPYGRKRFISVILSEHGTRVYLDGMFTKSLPGLFQNSDLTSRNIRFIILVKSSKGDYQWDGNIYGLSLCDSWLNGDDLGVDARSWLQVGKPAVLSRDGEGVSFVFKES